MEKLLHYVWMYKLLPSKNLNTTDGRIIKILDPGQHNTNQGPDFTNARIEIDGIVWSGNVEIHHTSSDWNKHKHHIDPVYNTTILHVVEIADKDIYMENGCKVPQVTIEVPAKVKDNYEELLATSDYPRCHNFVPGIPGIKVRSWLDALLAERLEIRSSKILNTLKDCCGDWEQTTFIT